MKVLWYLNLADGKYPWIENGLYPVDFDRYRRLAQTIDRGGFFGALVATWPNDPFISASFAASHTERMCFLVAVYARITPAKLLAQQALTFDAFTGGRLLMNLINGRDNIMETYGVTTSHDDRYALGEAYWREFHRYYAAGAKSNFPQYAARDRADPRRRNTAVGRRRQRCRPRSRRKNRRQLSDHVARR
jgi:alkanesulfonate monooxygenase